MVEPKRYLLLNPSDERWVNFIATDADANIFHHTAWMKLLAECYGYRPFVIALCDSHDRLCAGLPLMEVVSRLTGRRMVALPFSDFCRPLLSPDTTPAEFLQALQLWQRALDCRLVEVRWPLPSQPGLHKGKTFFEHVTWLEPDAERVFGRFKKTQVQQPIRRAEKSGVIVERAQTWESVRTYYGLHVQTRRRLGAPTQPLRFFHLLWDRVLSQDLGFLLLAFANSRPVAGAVFLHWNRAVIYKFSASDPSHWGLRPNNLLIWHAIRWACENGYRRLDWGRTDPENVGLRQFKNGWGSEECELHYSVLADQPPESSYNRLSRRLLTPLIQRSPVWVCRILGELLYGHFA